MIQITITCNDDFSRWTNARFSSKSVFGFTSILSLLVLLSNISNIQFTCGRHDITTLEIIKINDYQIVCETFLKVWYRQYSNECWWHKILYVLRVSSLIIEMRVNDWVMNFLFDFKTLNISRRESVNHWKSFIVYWTWNEGTHTVHTIMNDVPKNGYELLQQPDDSCIQLHVHLVVRSTKAMTALNVWTRGRPSYLPLHLSLRKNFAVLLSSIWQFCFSLGVHFHISFSSFINIYRNRIYYRDSLCCTMKSMCDLIISPYISL